LQLRRALAFRVAAARRPALGAATIRGVLGNMKPGDVYRAGKKGDGGKYGNNHNPNYEIIKPDGNKHQYRGLSHNVFGLNKGATTFVAASMDNRTYTYEEIQAQIARCGGKLPH
jgi:transcriptional/translational regulatory protein YebC/TACO1